MVEYNVVLLDRDHCETANDLVETLPAAKKRAKYLLSDDFARDVGSTHEMLDTLKVEIRNSKGECLWDAFAQPKADQAEDETGF